MFFGKDRNGPETVSFKVRIPTIASDDLVGNLGAPLRSTFSSGPLTSTSSNGWPLETRTSAAAGSSLRQRRKLSNKGKTRADPLLDWDVDDLDDEDLEDVEIISQRPMLVGLGIDPNLRGEGSGEAVRRKGFDGIGAEGEEVIALMTCDGNDSATQTPMQSARSKGEGDRDSLPPSRQPSKSTVDEGDALLGDADENDDEDTEEFHPRSSMASTVNSKFREVSPRRTSYF